MMREPAWIRGLQAQSEGREPPPPKPAKVAAASPPHDATDEVEALLAKIRPLTEHQRVVAALDRGAHLAAAHPGVPMQWPVASRRGDASQSSPLTPPVAAPSLFEGGDLPAVTAWGGDPQVLLSIPWQARPAVAQAPTQAAAYGLLETYSGPDGALLAELHGQPGGPLRPWVADYEDKLHVYAAAQSQALWDAEQRAEIGRRLAEAHAPPTAVQTSLMNKIQEGKRARGEA